MIARCRHYARLLAACTSGVGAVEFAIAAPFLILLYIGGFQLMDAISAYRKVTLTTRALADLTTRQESITDAKAEEFMNASRQVMAPYSTANINMRLTQIYIRKNGKPKLDWTRTTDAKKLKNTDLKIPSTMIVADSYIIQSTVVYHYTPVVGFGLVGPITFSDSILMNPRLSASIPMAGSCNTLLCQILDLTDLT